MAIKILIVSDRQDLQDSLKELVPDCDQISTYTSVEKIITLFKQELYNLVILDLLFIGENTPQLISQILASSGSNKSIIWGLADQNNLESLEEALSAGAHDYLSWPLDKKSLKLKCLVAKRQLSSLIEGAWHNESRLKHFKTDPSLDVETTTATRYDPIANVPLSLATVTHNITERKRAEEVLRASQQELSIIYENVTSIIFYLTVEADDMFRFVSVNPAFLQVTGLEKEQVIGKLVQEVVPQLPLELVLSRYREAIQTKQPIKWEEVRVFSTGTKYGEVTATPVCDVDGKVTHIIGIVHDITEHKQAEESLRLSEEKFSSLMYYSPIGKTIVASDGRLLEINPAFSKIIGYTKEELLAIVFQTITHPDDLQISLYYFSKLLNREVESYQLEKRYIHKDGHIIWAELNTSMVWNIDGTPRYCFSQIQDITERKQAKEALLLSKKKLLLAMDMAKLGYWEFDVDTQMITFDENLFKVYGRNIAEEGSFFIPIIDYAERFIPEKEIFIFIEEFAKAKATNNPNFSREFEHRIIKADGSTGYMLVRYAIVKDAQGHTVKTYGIVQDITARKIAEATLEQQRHQSNAIIKSASDGIISIDENQQILVFNPAAEKIFGCLSKEALGQPIDQFIPMRYRTNHKNLIEQFGETGISNRAMGEFREVSGLRKNGEEFAMEASISQSELAGHKLFTVTCRDVTERNQAQEALRESEERYRVIIEGAKEGIIFVEIDLFRFVYVNSSLCRMFGYSTKEFLKLLPADLTDEKSALRALGEAKALVKGEKTSILEIPCRRKDGKIFYVEVSASSLKLKGKDYVVGFITDVTKRRQAAAEQARLVSILEASPLFVGSANLDGSIMYLNKSLLKLFDIKADSNLSTYNIRDVHPAWAYKLIFDEGIPTALREGVWSGETAMINGKGVEIPVFQAIVGHRNENGDISFLSTIASDISETKRYSLLMEQSQEAAHIGGWEVDCITNEVHWTRETYAIHGLQPHEYNPTVETATQFYKASSLPIIRNAVERALKYGENYNLELELITAKGNRIWVRTIGKAIVKDGRTTKLYGSFQDITESRRNEEQLKFVMEGSNDGFWDCDWPPGKVTFSPRWAEMLGYTVSELGTNFDAWTKLVHPEDKPIVEKALMDHINGLTPLYQVDHRMQAKSGEWHWILTRGKAVSRDAQGKVTRLCGTHTDITERVTERRVAEEVMMASLKEKDAMLKEIHHRVKNNLQIINSLLNIQSAQVKDAAVIAAFTETKHRVRSMALLHETLYKSESFARIDLSSYIHSLCAHLSRSYGTNAGNIKMLIDIAEIELDLDRAIPIGLIINELVSNALKYAFIENHYGTISVKILKLDDKISLTVSDNGQGFPQEIDLHNTESLGLNLVCDLTHQLKGVLDLRNVNGTVFNILFPY